MSFASGPAPAAVAITDLKATLAEHEAHSAVAELIQDFLGTSDGSALSAAELSAELLASALADPLVDALGVDALKLEGSTQLAPSCNSDFPTNPTCNYPKFPDHSVPFGPAPAPNPPIASDCICGSPWVADTAARMMADLPAPAKMFAKDAFHDVADVHPFHLPHIFNDCPEGPDAKCVLNSTSLTMPVVKAGDLWPSALASRPLSAFELRSKLKSKEAYWSKAGVAGAGGSLDQNMSLCADINRAALQWAVEHAETGVAKRFAAKGEPLVIVDDQKATIGATGPEWIKDELVFSRVADSTSPTGTRVEVQSWMFVVGNANDGNVPWFLPAGMHYCNSVAVVSCFTWSLLVRCLCCCYCRHAFLQHCCNWC
ncbi:unnamed protein product [Polarella glacialis]|uniref:Uncharacterized protein n=1 Tax=Polarella glacialis TaxID=89957 RepID=A0A813M4H8_POLGL|nr:unnamed protein product [Polarella glacialis]